MLKLPLIGLSSREIELQDMLLAEKTKQASYLLYSLNKDHLRSFVSDPSNNFLVTFFYHSLDKEHAVPQCRTEALLSLLYFGLHYEHQNN